MVINIMSGMFKSTAYSVTVSKKGIKLISEEQETVLSFSKMKDISITQNGTSQARFEITIDDNIISGVFEDASDVSEFVTLIKKNAGKNLHTDLRFQ